jgi:hypothetical protein
MMKTDVLSEQQRARRLIGKPLSNAMLIASV